MLWKLTQASSNGSSQWASRRRTWVLRVRYEDVVADLETQVRRLLAHCGLPFEATCVDFHTTDRAVRTASSEQVRQPIYRDGLDQWQNYEPFLAPLKQALGPVLTAETKPQEPRTPL